MTVTPDRTMYSKSVAPEQRTIQISWSDGVDQSSFYDSNPDPDYFKVSSSVGSEPVAVYQDAPYLIEGILREIGSSSSPLVYLPSINTNNTIQILNRRTHHMLSVLNSEVSIESITGSELQGESSGEVFRIGTVSLLEIV